jgi:hypothetical protein
MKLFAALIALGLGLWASAGWATEPVTIPGSRLMLVPPEGFSLAKEFAGLQGDKASVLVVELPASAYDQLAAAISSGAMAKQGVEITSGEDLAGLPFRARIYRGRQVAQGMELDKWLMLADGSSTLTLINVSAVKGAAPVTDAQVREMFRSVRLSAAPAGDPVDALPFSLTPAPRFSHRQTIGGLGLVLTGAPPSPENAGRPGLIVTKAFEQGIPKAQWPQAVDAFRKSVQAIRIDKADDPKPAKVGDLEGLEFTATGSSNGEPRKVLVVMLFGPASGYALIAMASPELFDAALGDFHATMESFRLKP